MNLKMRASLKEGLGINIHSFDESNLFFSKLENIIDPEQKKKNYRQPVHRII